MANGSSGEEDGRVQKFNQMVRSIVTLALVAGLLYGFMVSMKISAEVFVPIAILVISWWFQRDAQRAAMKETAEALKMPPPYTTSTTTSSVATPPPPTTTEVKP